MRTRTFFTGVAVVAISVFIGVTAANLSAADRLKPKKQARVRQAMTARAMPATPFASRRGSYHGTLDLSPGNRGGRGVLEVKGTVQVNNPLPLNLPGVPNEVAYTVAVRVLDATGTTWVDWQPIGQVVDKAGVGNWSQAFIARFDTALMGMPPGKYFVEMIAHDPTKQTTERDGSHQPWALGASGAYYDVN